jgi:hypothetical protein
MVSRGVLLVALLFALGACGVQTANVGDCGDDRVAELDHVGPDGQPDPCHLQDPPEPASKCTGGQFVHWQVGWEEPVWLWFGSEEQAPECPQGSTTYEGHADLVAPDACEACTCELPTGACALPSTIVASSKDCGNFDAGMLTSFNPPVPWDGSCDSTAQLPAGAAHAVKVGALAMTEDGCAPGPTIPAKVLSWYWQTFARACDGAGWVPSLIQRSICIPDADPGPPGFHLCTVRKGEHDCPSLKDNVFTEQHIFFDGVDDKRGCSECTCGLPMGSICTATISIYKGGDLTCSGPPVDQLTISSATPKCIDIQPPGQALESTSAGPTTYIPGNCQPTGGQPNGLSATGTDPFTFCCRP